MEKKYLIKKAVITEKSLKDAANGVYTFEVYLHAKKLQIKKAIEKTFSVNVKTISTSIRKGKIKSVGRKRKKVKEKDIKIARVRLLKDEKIDLFEVSSTK